MMGWSRLARGVRLNLESRSKKEVTLFELPKFSERSRWPNMWVRDECGASLGDGERK